MPIKIIFNEFNDHEEEIRYYLSSEPTDIENMPAPFATSGPSSELTPEPGVGGDAVSFSVPWDETEEAYVRVSSVRSGVEAVSAEYRYRTLDDSQIGDEVGGGIYGGTCSNGTETWHVIFAKQAGESSRGPKWGNRGTKTGVTDQDDGLANQTEILTNHDDGSAEAFYHCRDYIDDEGNNDYYVPARNELALADALVDMSHPEFSTDLPRYRWTSCEGPGVYVEFYAYGRRFEGEDQIELIQGKGSVYLLVRPVRRVPV